ncbi:hypothetical protein L798_12021 [Zootermopsis nevadensis]|uniref:Uncharacterized protein n=1 Tax=Zootermopsis nevadensis TaxID=136037 RepID=A0A067QVG3_ZOONE|nr:hypothetical protein L798_12021 [Zootermopsis nevadensis]
MSTDGRDGVVILDAQYTEPVSCDNKKDSQGNELARSTPVVMSLQGKRPRCISRRQSSSSADWEIRVARPTQQRSREVYPTGALLWAFPASSVRYEKLEHVPIRSPCLSVHLSACNN